nr:phosphodiester glycosidase family protein [Leucobacter sp. cx-169]
MWGEYPLSRAIGGPANIDPKFLRVEIADGKIVRTSADLAELTAPALIGSGTSVLLARGAAVDLFASAQPGDAVPVTVSASSDVDVSISGSQRLLRDGVVTGAAGTGEPRTAAGVSADGSTIYIVSIDGRQSHSRGMALDELGQFMVELGAHNAVNLDGGGSSTLLMREPGTNEMSIGNAPSDGNLRNVPNSLVFSSTAEFTGVADVTVTPEISSAHADAVFPGLSRTVAGTGLDANRAATPTSGEFSIGGANATIAAVDGDTARVTGQTPGRASVSFTAEGKTASSELRVLGALEQLRASKSVIALPDGNTTATVQVTGIDRDGFSAPIETSDLTVAAGTDVLVEATGTDTFTITPQTASGAVTVSFSAGGHRVDVAVTVGLEEKSVADLGDGADWTFRSDRATGQLSPATGPNGEAALKLTYDFGSSTGTRGAYAVAAAPISIPGQPQAITMWLHGDGKATWPRLQLKTGAGTTINLDGPHTSWTGWQQVTFPVPTGTAFPLTLERVRMMETSAAKQYRGETIFAGITAVVAPDVAQPTTATVHDPLVVTNGTVDGRAQRIAVMSDAQFVARNPEGQNVQGARQTLREILAAKPEMFVIMGDFVDEAAPEDFDLARRILDEEIGDQLPWVYLPGNHEVMGGPIQNFIDEFGPTKTKQQLGSTLIITLNTADGSFNRSDSTQMNFLERALEDVADDSSITGVLVFAHHPADDPKASKDSQISDRLEARKFQARLAEFRADTGKSIAAMNGHAGVFHATSFDGVSNLLTGNSGKSPSGSPSQGGFTGWAMLGINPGAGVVGSDPAPVTSRTNWLQAEVKPRVDELTLGATAAIPAAMTLGDTITIDATLTQDGGRVVPVQWPMSALWAGDAVVIDDGSAEEAAAGKSSVSRAEATAAGVLRFNPNTGQLTATGEGTGTLTLSVNGNTVEHTVAVAAAPVDPNVPPVDPTVPGDGEQPGSGGSGAGGGTSGAGSSLAESGSDELQPWLAGALGAAFLGAAAIVFGGRRKRA